MTNLTRSNGCIKRYGLVYRSPFYRNAFLHLTLDLNSENDTSKNPKAALLGFSTGGMAFAPVPICDVMRRKGTVHQVHQRLAHHPDLVHLYRI